MEKRKRIVLLVVPLLFLLLALMNLLLLSNMKAEEKKEMKVSGIQVVQSEDTPINNAQRKTRILGDNINTISEDMPYVYLKNDESTSVYLQFDVIEADTTIYSSNLIEPGMMEKLDVYSLLDKGKHCLEYHITSYDLENKNVLLSGIKQLKEINIS